MNGPSRRICVVEVIRLDSNEGALLQSWSQQQIPIAAGNHHMHGIVHRWCTSKNIFPPESRSKLGHGLGVPPRYYTMIYSFDVHRPSLLSLPPSAVQDAQCKRKCFHMPLLMRSRCGKQNWSWILRMLVAFHDFGLLFGTGDVLKKKGGIAFCRRAG